MQTLTVQRQHTETATTLLFSSVLPPFLVSPDSALSLCRCCRSRTRKPCLPTASPLLWRWRVAQREKGGDKDRRPSSTKGKGAQARQNTNAVAICHPCRATAMYSASAPTSSSRGHPLAVAFSQPASLCTGAVTKIKQLELGAWLYANWRQLAFPHHACCV